MDDTNKIMFRHILSRTDIPYRKTSLRLLLRMCDMEQYLDVCSTRIADEELIDGEDVEINFLEFPDLLFTNMGLLYCEEILLGYISQENFNKVWKLSNDMAKITDIENNQITMYRSTDNTTLLKMLFTRAKSIVGTTKEITDEHFRLIKQMAALELWSRTLFSRAWHKLETKFYGVYCSIRYRNLCKIFKNIAKQYENNDLDDTK